VEFAAATPIKRNWEKERKLLLTEKNPQKSPASIASKESFYLK
jgi:hypothetical protein